MSQAGWYHDKAAECDRQALACTHAATRDLYIKEQTILKRGTAFGLAGERPIHWELATLLAKASRRRENLITCVPTALQMSAFGG
jgi:hypothetical protein